VRICQHLNLAHQSASTTHWRSWIAIIVALKSKPARRRVAGVPVIPKGQTIEGRFFPLLFDPRVMGN
jgi:hypothetical protein